MININEFRDFVLFVMNKEGNGEEPSPAEFNRVADHALAEWTSIKLGNPRLYQPGRPIAPQSIDITERVIDDLRHLKETREFLLAANIQAQAGNPGRLFIPDGDEVDETDINGLVPPEYMYFLRLDHVYQFTSGSTTQTATREVRLKNTNQITNILTSLIAPPTNKRPVCEINDTYIQVYPTTINKVIFTYLRVPNTPVWGFTTQNNRPVYNAATSTDIDAPYINKNDIAMIYLKYQGIHLNDAQLAQFANQMQQQGV